MRSRIKFAEPMPSTDGPYTREEVERIERQYPTATAAEKYRLMQAQRLIDWHERSRSQRNHRTR